MLSYTSPESLNGKIKPHEDPRIEAFKADFNHSVITATEGTPELWGIVDYYAEAYKDHLRYLQETDDAVLRATGEIPLITPYDHRRGPHILASEDAAAFAHAIGYVDTWLNIHPSAVESLIELETNGGYTPAPPKDIPALAKFTDNKDAVHSSAFAFKTLSTSEAKALGLNPPSSANAVMCDGLWVASSNGRNEDGLTTTSFLMGNSVPDSTSAHSNAAICINQGRAFVPGDSIWIDPVNQFHHLRRTRELIRSHPLMQSHPFRDFLLQRALQLPGVTIKANPHSEVERLKKIEGLGEEITSVRVYDPRARSVDTTRTVAAIREAFPNAYIIAGNGTNPKDAEDAMKAGANAFTIILGGGGICLTPEVAQVAVENIRTAKEVSDAGLDLPIVADSGTGETYTMLAAAGVSAFMKGQGINGGIEKPPYLYWKRDEKGRWVSDYSGEAAYRTKTMGGKADPLGRAIFPEGIDSEVRFRDNEPTVSTAIGKIRQRVATSLIFARCRTLEELRRLKEPQLLHVTGSAQYAGRTHHDI